MTNSTTLWRVYTPAGDDYKIDIKPGLNWWQRLRLRLQGCRVEKVDTR